MNKLFFALLLYGCASSTSNAQHAKLVSNVEFDKTVKKYLSFTVPVISVNDLDLIKGDALILDTREKEEYDVSHIEGAQYAGYKKFNIDHLKDIPKDKKIVVYCSIGYRSEKIGDQLQKEGFTNVSNLYGSIFEWVNQGYDLVNDKGETTDEIHAYSKAWSKWISNKEVKKIW